MKTLSLSVQEKEDANLRGGTGYRDAVAATADALTWGTALSATSRIATGGLAALGVSVRFTASGDTCPIYVGLFNAAGEFLGVFEDTATDGNQHREGTTGTPAKYAAPLLIFPTMGAHSYEVRKGTSSDTLDLHAWVA